MLHNQRSLVTVALLSLIVTLPACHNHQPGNSSHEENAWHLQSSHESNDQTRNRPSNQVAVLTVWAEADKLDETALFYKNVLGLRSVGSGPSQHILDTDGSFLVIMEGQLDQPRNTKKRWPLFALTVPNLDNAIKTLTDAGVESPWGIEEFGEPNPSSRYVMFYDPAGNLIEIVEWL